MNSNIVFKSNVYPVNGEIKEDTRYLSNIWDYNRISYIDKKNFQMVSWPAFQRRILEQTPYCSYNREDPCWGMVKGENGYFWRCMCTKTECKLFSRCRAGYPYNDEKEKSFVPLTDYSDEYGYQRFISEYDAFPVLVEDVIEEYSSGYSDFVIKRTSALTDEKKGVSTFEKIVRQESQIDLDAQKPDENQDDKKQTENRTEEGVLKKNQFEKKQDDKKPDDEVERSVLNKDKSGKKDIISVARNNGEGKSNRSVLQPKARKSIFDNFEKSEQTEIITENSKNSFFVDAGPGTGKTYTLLQKLNYLVTEKGIEADGILVLCFTNAAVDEIKTRLKNMVQSGADRSLVNVDIRTFHSFAWWLIGQSNDLEWTSINLMGLSYEMSLHEADKILKRHGSEVVGEWEYFIVDEVQDLTNMLGYFVLSIVHACLLKGCGVTVLGDACQSIYDYDQETRFPLKSPDFYKRLYDVMKDDARFVLLSENHRQSSELIKLTSGLRKAILDNDISEMHKEVEKLIDSADSLEIKESELSDEYFNRLRNGGTVSLLFRNNGQTLKMSSDLRKRGINHALNYTETQNNYETWISDVFFRYSKQIISEEEFISLYGHNRKNSGDDVWERLQRLLHTDNDSLIVRDILDAVATSKIDDPILRINNTQNVVVSNIHRAKGREYDCVLVDKTFADTVLNNTDPDEVKTLYVAITRPKNDLYFVPLRNSNKLRLINVYDTQRKRWGSTKNKMISYFELRGFSDIAPEVFAKTDQELFDTICMGDSLYLKRVIEGKYSMYYEIVHEETENVLGIVTSDSPYLQDLMAYMKIDSLNLVNMPCIINDLYVSGIYSQVVSTECLNANPELRRNAPNGVWKWIDIMGAGHAEYDVY